MFNTPTISEPLTGSMNVVCAWCKTPMGHKDCRVELDGLKSHGICKICFVKHEYRDLCDRISRADCFDLARITLIELPQIDNDADRLALREMAKERSDKI